MLIDMVLCTMLVFFNGFRRKHFFFANSEFDAAVTVIVFVSIQS